MKTVAKLALKAGMLAMCFTSVACSALVGPETTNLDHRGDVTEGPLVKGGPTVEHSTIYGKNLSSGKHYYMPKGILTIRGDFPANTKLDIASGRLIVEGNIGEGAKISANMPQTYKSHKRSGKGNRYAHTPTGLVYAEDETPGIIVTGSIGENAEVYSNAGIKASCAAPSAYVRSAYQRPVQTTVKFNC